MMYQPAVQPDLKAVGLRRLANKASYSNHESVGKDANTIPAVMTLWDVVRVEYNL